jgi:hypothetical protein
MMARGFFFGQGITWKKINIMPIFLWGPLKIHPIQLFIQLSSFSSKHFHPFKYFLFAQNLKA